MAAPTPRGTAVNAVTNMTNIVPIQALRIPAWAGNRDGNDVKNRQEIRPRPSNANWPSNASNTSSARIITLRPSRAKNRSSLLRQAISRLTGLGSVDLSVAAFKDMAGNIEHQCDE